MKYGTNNFLDRLFKTDVRRHASGIKAAINRDKVLKDAPLRDVVLIVSYIEYPPTIKPYHISEAPKDLDEASHGELARLHESLLPNQFLVYLKSSRGGAVSFQLAHRQSTNLLDGPAVYGGDAAVVSTTNAEASASMSSWSRVPAQSFGGRDLEFEVDGIDACLLDAHCNYRPGASDADSSEATTVFDYLEKRIQEEELVPDLNFLEI